MDAEFALTMIEKMENDIRILKAHFQIQQNPKPAKNNDWLSERRKNKFKPKKIKP